MTELETMQRAKLYMDKLAQGIDPITDQQLPGDSALNNARLSRCFSYVSDVLEKVIANGGTVGYRTKNQEFTITPDQLAKVQLSEYPIRISEFIDALYQAVENSDMRRLSAVRITDWLVSKGLMRKEVGADGKMNRLPTESGLQMGMSTQLRQSRDGEYQAVYYDKTVQRFLLSNIEEIMAYGK